MNTFYEKKRRFLLVLIILFCANYSQAQNLLNLDYWAIGIGNAGNFTANGALTENIREWGDGPDGKRVVLWKAQPDGAANADGGWDTSPFDVNHTKMYRFTVWIKKNNSFGGGTFFGCKSVSELNGTANDNPYFFVGNLPALDKWYLLVGYVHGSGDDSQTSLGGVYDGVTGAKVVACTDFKFTTSTLKTYHRTYLYYDPTTADRQYFYAPRVDVVNGNEPSVESLLNVSGAPGATAYFPGKVGIKTADPGAYELAVNGNVRAKEVRVETGWSDFVFEKNYPLLSLPEVEAFIEENKHLPDVPSEKEVLKNGVELGSVNSKLLQKIEELTLYVIQLNKERKPQQSAGDLALKEMNESLLKKVEELTKLGIEQNKRIEKLEAAVTSKH